MNSVEESIINNSHKYKITPKKKYISQSGRNTMWFDYIHNHFYEDLLPKIQSQGELFIEYWPVWYINNGIEKKYIADGTSRTEWYGLTGAGYLCLTNKGLLCSYFKNLNKRYSFLTQFSAADVFLQGFLNQPIYINHMESIKADGFSIIEYSELVEINVVQKYCQEMLLLRTYNKKFEIGVPIENHLYQIRICIEMGKKGMLNPSTQ